MGNPFIAPLYPLLSGGIAALAGLGNSAAFPSHGALGPHCSTAIPAMVHAYGRLSGTLPLLWIGFLGWGVLMAGLVAVLRAFGHGRCGWEPVVVTLVACLPPVFMTLSEYFHPQDLLAMGLVLGSLACVKRGSWAWAGVLLGLAITSQQFALLVLAPLVVVVPRNLRIRFAGSATATVAFIVVPIVAVTSGRALGPAVLGSGDGPWYGRTLLGIFPIHGLLLIAVSRILPIVLAMMLALWAMRQLGSALFEPLPLASLIATSLSLRLVFEQNLFGYYFMALAVMLVVLDVLRGRISVYLVGWLALVALRFNPLPWGFDPLTQVISLRLWQVALVGIAVVLAASPLTSLAFGRPETRPLPEVRMRSL